jgi:hypothetical protein
VEDGKRSGEGRDRMTENELSVMGSRAVWFQGNVHEVCIFYRRHPVRFFDFSLPASLFCLPFSVQI